jgi:hypothetical protein
MSIQEPCGKLRELNIVGLVDELGYELFLLSRDSCAHVQVRTQKHLKIWKKQLTSEMHTALLNRHVIPELRFSKLDERSAVITELLVQREALGAA